MRDGRRKLELSFRPWKTARAGAQHRSIWLDQALALESPAAGRPLQGARSFDVGIVGGGFTGLWTAHRLRDLDPGLRIAIVEADFCGAGASGRNSGAMGHWWPKLPALIRLLGAQDAKRVLQASIDVLADMRRFIAEHAIDCELRSVPSVWSATAPAQVGAWNGVLRAAESIGTSAPYRPLSREELRGMFGAGPYLAGVLEESVTRIQPAMLARGLKREAEKREMEIFEHSPVLRISGGKSIAIETQSGRIECAKAVLAANAWMAHLPEFRPSIVVVSSDIVITDPIPEVLERVGMLRRPGGVNSRLMLNYGGITPDGRVYVGRGGGTLAFDARIGPEFDWSARQAAEVEDDFRYLYPELKEVPIARAWAGPVDRSTTGLPWFGRLEADPRIHYAIGYSGHGVAASALGGRILASALLDRHDDWTALAECFQRARRGSYPPEPIRYLGGRLVRRAVFRKELAEREARAPSALDLKLASFAPATLTDSRKSKGVAR